MDGAQLTDQVAALLGRAGADLHLHRAAVSGNNQVFVITGPDVSAVVKRYYNSPADSRDRLEAEWSFIGYAERVGLRCVPRRIAVDRNAHMAVYEYVDGAQLSPGDVGSEAVGSAVAFFRSLNSPPSIRYAGVLPEASEACFSVSEHFAIVDRRLQGLSVMQPACDIDAEALDFVGELRERWVEIRRRVAARAASLGVPLAARLPSGNRCISPSDFGFHNALVRPGGELCFLDFEYAGWDDPAKMVADFFCQPSVPVDSSYFDWFLDETMSYAADSKSIKLRARLLQPVFRTKWCCIMMNDFIPESARRRRFAAPETDEQVRKRVQLNRARQAFHSLQDE